MKAFNTAILFGILLVAVSALSFHFGRETKKPQLKAVRLQTHVHGTMKIMGKPGPVDLHGELIIEPEFNP